MSYVVTLICNPKTPILTPDLVQAAQKILPAAAIPRWLAPEIAADIIYTPTGDFDRSAQILALRKTLGSAPVDIVVQPVQGRRKRLFVADMDSTIIGQECIDELADLVGLKAKVSQITERAMRGEIAFEPALRERVGLLKGLKANVVGEVIEKRISLTPGAINLVRTMRAHGAYTALVSGGFTAFTTAIAEKVGFDENRANELIVENDVFVGRVREPILGANAKRASLLELREKSGLSPIEVLATGDGANDLAMLGEAGLGIAYHAKPAVAAAADARIDYGDLTALLYAQGFSHDQFVA